MSERAGYQRFRGDHTPTELVLGVAFVVIAALMPVLVAWVLWPG